MTRSGGWSQFPYSPIDNSVRPRIPGHTAEVAKIIHCLATVRDKFNQHSAKIVTNVLDLVNNQTTAFLSAKVTYGLVSLGGRQYR